MVMIFTHNNPHLCVMKTAVKMDVDSIHSVDRRLRKVPWLMSTALFMTYCIIKNVGKSI